jgi:hypothetical protein
MIEELLQDRLSPFRDEALSGGIPAGDVERWSTLARPCATLTRSGDGPVVGRFGGPLLLPADAPDPAHPFVASIDLAALPAEATDLPLPPDGRLLLFAVLEHESDPAARGSAVHVPAGAAVVERNGPATGDAEYPEGPLRLRIDVSLPLHYAVDLPDGSGRGPLPGHPRAEELVEVWDDTHDDIAPWGPMQIGGYAAEEAVYTDPVADAVSDAVRSVAAGRWAGPVSDDPADWVLLADWDAGMDVECWEGATVHWVVQREDLVARRFDRVFTTFFWNP